MVGNNYLFQEALLERSTRTTPGRQRRNKHHSTILIGIIAALNSGTIAQDGDNFENLTPSHLLTGEKLTIQCGSERATNKDLSTEFRIKQRFTGTSGGGGSMNTLYSFVTNIK
jgi:hypothetical protein